ncbi:MAG: hypothetical protein WBC40_07195 [Halobacteriota archaeon]
MLLQELTEVYEKVRGTTKKLEKIALVSELLRNTPSETLPLVCYMLRGWIFPEHSAFVYPGLRDNPLWTFSKSIPGADKEAKKKA